VWKTDIKDIFATPALSDEQKQYVLSDSKGFFCLDAWTGAILWSNTALTGASSPAIGQDGTVYFGTGDNFYAIDPVTQAIKWSYPTGGGWSSPTIGSDETIYVGGGNKKLYAIRPDGNLKWSYDIGYPVHSSPAIGRDGTIYVGSADSVNQGLYAIDPNGNLKWTYPTSGGLGSAIAMAPDGAIYAIDDGGVLYAVNSDGTSKWEQTGYFPFRHQARCVSIRERGNYMIVAPHDRQISGLNPDGSIMWDLDVPDRVTSPTARAYGITYVGVGIMPGSTVELYAISDSGDVLWTWGKGTIEWWLYASPIAGNDTSVYFVSYCEAVWKLKCPDAIGIHESDRLKKLPSLTSSPNPVCSKAAISYTLPGPGQAGIKIYNIAGESVRTMNLGNRRAGPHKSHWDLRSDSGERVKTGVYFCELWFKSVKKRGKIVVAR
jgi:outer membrane protein assembly factor BamB